MAPNVGRPTAPERRDIHTLHRYYIWQNKMRELFYEELQSAAARNVPIEIGSNEQIRVFHYMSYWYAGLFVVIEGWREMGLQDQEIANLLDSPNVDLLRRYRNGVFHFQRTYFDERFLAFIRDGEDVVDWVRSLNSAFGRFFLNAFQAEPEGQ